MKLVQLLPRWLRKARPLEQAVTRWLEDKTDDVLILEHRFARCEVQRDPAGQTVTLRLPASTLLSQTIHDDGIVWAGAQGFQIEQDTGCATLTVISELDHHAIGRARRELVDRIESVVQSMFSLNHGAQPVLSRQPQGQHHPHALTTSDGFAQAMRALAHSRSQPDRKRVYEQFLNHIHLLPLQAMPTMDRPRVFVTSTSKHGEVWSTFTNWSDASRWRLFKDDGPWTVVSGIQLVAMSQSLECLQINPGSRLGGEFFGHELRRIADVLGLTWH